MLQICFFFLLSTCFFSHCIRLYSMELTHKNSKNGRKLTKGEKVLEQQQQQLSKETKKKKSNACNTTKTTQQMKKTPTENRNWFHFVSICHIGLYAIIYIQFDIHTIHKAVRVYSSYRICCRFVFLLYFFFFSISFFFSFLDYWKYSILIRFE